MAGPLNFEKVRAEFLRYHKEMMRVLIKYQVRNWGDRTDDAWKLVGGHDWQTLLKPSRDLLAGHVSRFNNPHNENTISVDTLSLDSVNSSMRTWLPMNALPVSSYGYIDFYDDAGIRAQWGYSGFRLSVNTVVKAIMSGLRVDMAPRSFDLQALYPTRYTNNVFYVGILRKFGQISYHITEVGRAPVLNPPVESSSYMYIGKVSTGNNGIDAIDIRVVSRIGDYRPSVPPIGGGIPISQGTFGMPVPLNAGWKP